LLFIKSMNKLYSFEKLHVWSDCRAFAKEIYQLTNNFPNEEKFGLVSQLRRSIVSVISNLAEGSSRSTSNDKASFYRIAYSSLMEVVSQIIISYDLGYISEETYDSLRSEIQVISYKINALYSSTLNKSNESEL